MGVSLRMDKKYHFLYKFKKKYRPREGGLAKWTICFCISKTLYGLFRFLLDSIKPIS